MPKPVITFSPNTLDYFSLEIIREEFYRQHGCDLSISEAIRKAINAHAEAIRKGRTG